MRRAFAVAALALAGGAYWWRKNPSACPYSQRFWVDAPHPLITRGRLREALQPSAGERVLEIGPGTGYYTNHLAEWVGPDGAVEILDVQREMLDHTLARARELGVENITEVHANAEALPQEEASFDAVVLVTVLGEIPDRDAALREVARVLRPDGRLIVGELFGDPHWVSPGALEREAGAAGLSIETRLGPAIGYFARLRREPRRTEV